MGRGRKSTGIPVLLFLDSLRQAVSNCAKTNLWDYALGNNIGVVGGIRDYRDCMTICNHWSGCTHWTWNYAGTNMDKCYIKTSRGPWPYGLASVTAESGWADTCNWCLKEEYNCNANSYCTAWVYTGTALRDVAGVTSELSCAALCYATSNCESWTWSGTSQQCGLKDALLSGRSETSDTTVKSGTPCIFDRLSCHYETGVSYGATVISTTAGVPSLDDCSGLCVNDGNCYSWRYGLSGADYQSCQLLGSGNAVATTDSNWASGLPCNSVYETTSSTVTSVTATSTATTTSTVSTVTTTATTSTVTTVTTTATTATATTQTTTITTTTVSTTTVSTSTTTTATATSTSSTTTSVSTSSTTVTATSTTATSTTTITSTTETTSSTTVTTTRTTSSSTSTTISTSSTSTMSSTTTTTSSTATTSTTSSTTTESSTATTTSSTATTSTTYTTSTASTTTTTSSLTTSLTTSSTSTESTTTETLTMTTTTTTFAPAAKCVVTFGGVDCDKLLQRPNMTKDLIAAAEEGIIAAFNAKSNGSQITREHCSSTVFCQQSQSRRLTSGTGGMDVETVISAVDAAIPVADVVSTLDEIAQAGEVTSAVQEQVNAIPDISDVALPGATVTVAEEVSTGLFLGPPPPTTTVLFQQPGVHPVQVILAPDERALLTQLRDDPAMSDIGMSATSAEIVASRLGPSGDGTLVPILGTGAAVFFPAGSYEGVGDAAITVSLVDPSLHPSLTGPLAVNGRTAEVAAALNVEMWSLSTGERIPVQGLQTPINMSIPVNNSEEYVCGYWDVNVLAWQTNDLVSTYPNSTILGCATGHLTFFAAIWKGFLATLLCANIDMLTWAAFREIWAAEDAWYSEPFCLAYFVFVAGLLLLFITACVVDWRRMSGNVWTDECFLIPTGDKSGENAEHEDGPTIGLEEDTRVNRSLLACCAGSNVSVNEYCSGSSAVRDALDEIFSSWFAYFSEVRDLLENIWDAVASFTEYREMGGVMLGVAHAATASLVTKSVRSLTGGRLNISDELVEFIMEDEDVRDLLLQAARLTVKTTEGEDKPSQSMSVARQRARHEQRLRAWHELHESILASVDADWHAFSRWRWLPWGVSRLFRFQVPPINALLGNPFIPASMRVMLLVVDLSGSWLLAAFFFQASGGVRGKRQRGNCDVNGLGTYLGRLLAILFTSTFLAELPETLIASMHVRSFRKVAEEEGPEWHNQLRVWRMQDRMFWVLSVLYTLLCNLFIIIFFANCHPDDISGFGYSGVMSVSIEFAIFPLALAVTVPLLAMCALSITSMWQGEKKGALLDRRRKQLADRGNWSPIVMSI